MWRIGTDASAAASPGHAAITLCCLDDRGRIRAPTAPPTRPRTSTPGRSSARPTSSSAWCADRRSVSAPRDREPPPSSLSRARRGSASSACGFSARDMSPGSSPTATARTARRRILAERVFGNAGDEHHARRLEGAAQLTRDQLAQLLGRPVARPVGDHAEAPDRLALRLVGHAHDRRLHHRRVRHEHRLDLRRAESLAGHVDRVVGAAQQVPVAVVVDQRPVAVAPHVRVHRPVRLHVALGVAPDAARHPRPRPLADQLAHLAPHRVPVAGRTRRCPCRARRRRASTP